MTNNNVEMRGGGGLMMDQFTAGSTGILRSLSGLVMMKRR